ncbi:hypothetical protein HDU81_004814 [Chytriomyces hyalinus]|nr:hypothetical protein HDU81_004814 [Chytriomyces hyalinus]
MKLTALIVLAAGVLAAVNPSVPTTGQQSRFRALPRGSNLAISPVDGAEFLAGQHFDISIELHSESAIANLDNLSFTINGKDVAQVFDAKPFVSNYNSTYFANTKSQVLKAATKFNVARVSLRNIALPASGDYQIELKAGSEKVSATWTVKGSSTRKVKNAILFIGDGMAPSMISAARYISRNTKFGKFQNGDGFLNMEHFDAMGKIATNGIDAIITDSANSAAAYASGQKGWVNTLNVYADTTTKDQLDDPKVEVLAEVIRRVRPGMCIGVVSTASIVDATPAAVFGHTRSRGQGQILVDQAINGFRHLTQANSSQNIWAVTGEPMPWSPAVKPDVLLGGGGEWFTGSDSLNGTDYYKVYADAGYKIAHDKDELSAITEGPVLGIFTAGHMDTWFDREVEKVNLKINANSGPKLDKTSATNQPGLEAMTLKAIEIMEKKCADGYFLMSEAAAIDKAMHPMDYDRGLADLLEFDRTLTAVRALPSAKDTAIFLTADHAQGYDVYGSVDLDFFRSASNDDSIGADGQPQAPISKDFHAEQRNAVGTYEVAGWVDNVLDEFGLPTKFRDARFRLAGGKVDGPTHVENFEFKTPAAKTNPLSRNPSSPVDKSGVRSTSVYGADPHDSVNGAGLARNGVIPANSGSSVHTLQAVDLYCYGPVAKSCSKFMDNTELFFLIADALGLGDKPDAVAPGPDCPAVYTPSPVNPAPVNPSSTAANSAAYNPPTASANVAPIVPATSNGAYVAPSVKPSVKPSATNLYSSAASVSAGFVAVAFALLM